MTTHTQTGETLAIRMRKARNAKGLTQQELADASGLSRDAIAKIETGHAQFTRKIQEIAKVLDVSAAWLQFGVEEVGKLEKDSLETALAFQELSESQQEKIKSLIEKYKEINRIENQL